MTITVDVERGEYTTDPEPNGLRPRVLVVWDGATIPVEEWRSYVESRAELAKDAPALSLQESGLETLTSSMRRDSPVYWSMFFVDFLVRPTYLARLELEASRSLYLPAGPERRAAVAIRNALANASHALGFERRRGRPRKMR